MTTDKPPRDEVGQLRDAVTVLAQDVDRNATRLEAVADAVTKVRDVADGANTAATQMVNSVANLTKEVRARSSATRLAGVTADEGPRVIPWLTLDDPKVAGAVLADLADWLKEVYVRYPEGELSECWAWHPSAVAELVTLRDGWIDAFLSEEASPVRAMDWHDRWRPGVARRVNKELATCSLAEHAPNGKRHYHPNFVSALGQLDELAHWWATTHGTGAAPAPWPDTVAEADAARRAAYDRRSF